jgi:hypothetical protein
VALNDQLVQLQAEFHSLALIGKRDIVVDIVLRRAINAFHRISLASRIARTAAGVGTRVRVRDAGAEGVARFAPLDVNLQQ